MGGDERALALWVRELWDGEGEELRKLREWGDADKELGVRDAKRSVKCLTDFSSVKYLTIFAFNWKYFTFVQLFYCKTNMIKSENIFLKIFYIKIKC